MHVSEHGSKVGVAGDELHITKDGEVVGRVRLIEVSQINLHGNVQLTTQALRACSRVGIPILYFGFGNWFEASVVGLPHKNVQLRQAQYRASFDPGRCLFISRAMITAKIANQRVLLRRNAQRVTSSVLDELKRLRIKAAKAPSLESLLGLESLAARHDFEDFPSMLKSVDVRFNGRNRRPPIDPVNAVLSFCYAMLAKEATVALHTVGLDPYQGFYHQGRYGRPSLALDLMEEFRPLVADSVVLTLFNTKQVTREDFYFAGQGCSLRQRAKKSVISAFERRMSEELTHPIFGYKASYRRTLTCKPGCSDAIFSTSSPRIPVWRRDEGAARGQARLSGHVRHLLSISIAQGAQVDAGARSSNTVLCLPLLPYAGQEGDLDVALVGNHTLRPRSGDSVRAWLGG